ncbi:uncharacterized protein LOC119665224, partial [Teleopsis dalmanni]|uniref:uncharacterized protein LOC119665224 n=1 Tax=Teleopsis dalmanni TaxID=139649 RepID=UPI0018CF75C7
MQDHKTLINIFSSQRCGVNMVHFNARSLSGLKLDYVRSVFEGSKVDVICVSETWFDHNISSVFFSLNGFDLFRHDRKHRLGGGVAIFCKSHLKGQLVSVSMETEIEHISERVLAGNYKILVTCAYNPNKIFSCDPLFDSLLPIAVKFDFLAVFGDFNIDFLLNSAKAAKLNDLMTMTGLSVENNSMPTRFSNNVRPSLLDLVAVSDLSKVLFFEQISFVSDPDLLFVTFDYNATKTFTPTQFSFWDFKSIDTRRLFSELNSVDWSGCWFSASVDEKLGVFNNILSDFLHRFVPYRTVCAKNSSCPWFKPYIKRKINYRNKKYAVWKKYPTALNWMRFKVARNLASAAIYKAKLMFFKSKLGGRQQTKSLWNNIKSLGIIKNSTAVCSLDPNNLNDYFVSSVGSRLRVNPAFPCLEHAGSESIFSFECVSEEVVFNSVMKIKSNAIGIDKIPLKFLKLTLQSIISPLTHIINHCFASSTFPNTWKLAKIIPIEKKSNASLCSDFRPISILSSLSK